MKRGLKGAEDLIHCVDRFIVAEYSPMKRGLKGGYPGDAVLDEFALQSIPR